MRLLKMMLLNMKKDKKKNKNHNYQNDLGI